MIHNRYWNPSFFRISMAMANTGNLKIISSNKMRAQKNKCHTSSVLLFNQLSFVLLHVHTSFLLMVLWQNFMLIKIKKHMKTWVSKSTKTKLCTFKILIFINLTISSSGSSTLKLKPWFLSTVNCIMKCTGH